MFIDLETGRELTLGWACHDHVYARVETPGSFAIRVFTNVNVIFYCSYTLTWQKDLEANDACDM